MEENKTRYNKLLEEEFGKGDYLISAGDTVTQEKLDRIATCAYLAAEKYLKETAIKSIKNWTT